MIIPALWERISRTVSKGRTYTPKNVVHIDANLSPEDIKLSGANESKLAFIYSGSKPLKHPSKLQLTNEMENEAKLLHKFLPVVLALGIKSTLNEVSDMQLLEYEGLLKADADEREGRKCLNFNFEFLFLVIYSRDSGLVQAPRPNAGHKKQKNRAKIRFCRYAKMRARKKISFLSIPEVGEKQKA